MKKVYLVLSIISVVLFLTACSSKLDDSTIKEEVKTEIVEMISEENIDTIEVVERKTNDETKDTVVDIKVVSNDGVIEYTRYYTANFYFTDEKEWYISSMVQNSNYEWSVLPISGVNEEIIKKSLNDCNISINHDTWVIQKNKIEKFSIVEQKTNLKEKTDTVIVAFTLDDVVQKASGELTLTYTFNDEWKLVDSPQNVSFTTTTKPECELVVTTDTIIKELEGKEILLNIGTSHEQAITIAETEVSNIVIYEEITGEKGRNRIFKCTCDLIKSNATLKLDISLSYYYEESWLVQPVTVSAEIASLDIVGEWTGRYTGAGNLGSVTLTITEITEDGKIKGTYSYTPDKIDKYTQAGSYAVSGNIDMKTLFIKLESGDWISKDSSAFSFTKSDINAYLMLEDAEINGLGQSGYPFVVEKK